MPTTELLRLRYHTPLLVNQKIKIIFWGPLWYFFDPKTLFGIRNLTFGGVILLTYFDLSYGFWDFQGCDCQNGELSTPKTLIGSKNVRSRTPPKVRFLMQNKVLESKKYQRGPKKWKKNCFSQKRPILYFTWNLIWHQWTSWGPPSLEFVLSINF